MMGLILLGIGLVGQWLLGLAIADLFLDERRGRHQDDAASATHLDSPFTERVGLGLILGIGGTSWILFVWSLCGGSLGFGISLAISAMGFVCGGNIIRREISCRRELKDLPSSPERSHETAQERSWCRFCQLMIAIMFVATLTLSLITPQRLWDERATFAIKGIVLNQDHSVYSRDLADPDFVQFHPRYPLLIPLAEQHIYALLGKVDDRLSKVIFPLLYLGMVVAMAGGLCRHLTEGAAWLFAMLLATIPVLTPWEYGFPCGQADAAMACFHGTSVLYLWSSWQSLFLEKPNSWFRSPMIAGLCGAMASFTKDEGIAFLMVDGIAVSLVLIVTRTRIRAFTVALVTFGIALAVLTPWMLHRSSLPLTTEANYFGRMSLKAIMNNMSNLRWQVPHLASRMFREYREWGLQWWLVVFAAIAAPRRMMAPSQLLLLLDVVGALLFLMLAGILAATEVTEHIGGSSHRYLMQLSPVAILFAAGQLGASRRRN